MGKYIKKSKTTRDIGFTEVSKPIALGVRTRAAKTLALKRLNSTNSPAESAALSGGSRSSFYFQLRSRRLEKPPSMHIKAGIKESRVDSDSVPESRRFNGEASCGEKRLDFKSRHNIRQSTPCKDVEDFFAYAEQQQQSLFMDKYNFDIVNDMPMNGRYEWVQVMP